MTVQTIVDEKAINSIRFLAADAVQKARSGHPGAPMGAATMAYIAGLGIDLPAITQKLQDEGVASFTDAFQSLLASVAVKREMLLA